MATESGFNVGRVMAIMAGGAMVGAGEVELLHYFLPLLTPKLPAGIFFLVGGLLFVFGAIWWPYIRSWIKPTKKNSEITVKKS